MDIPVEVFIAASRWLQNNPDSKIEHLGDYEGRDAFCVDFDQHIGYPPVFLYKDGEVTEVFGEKALEILASFPE